MSEMRKLGLKSDLEDRTLKLRDVSLSCGQAQYFDGAERNNLLIKQIL